MNRRLSYLRQLLLAVTVGAFTLTMTAPAHASTVAEDGGQSRAAQAVTSVASATTTTTLASCPVGSLCGWSGSYFTGPMTTFGGAPCVNSPIPLRSVANTYGWGWLVVLSVYSGPNCSGTRLGSVGSGQSRPFLPGVGVSVSTAW
jgi:hypothetical protein